MSKTLSASPVHVNLADRSYDVLVGSGLIEGAGSLVAPIAGKRPLIILSDETVAPLYLGTLTRSLEAAGARVLDPIVVPAGEATKSFHHLEAVLEILLSRGIERGAMLVALGGGVIGDLGGFAAAIALRGLDFIQVPTTLLSQVDSSVGGKTGINSRQGKNLIGAFHQPRLVLADIGALDSLPRREVLAGYAEVVKYGLIDRPDFFTWLEGNGPALVAGDAALRTAAVKESVAAKAAIVAQDEREGGVRALLNLGHTFGHALEAEMGYGGELLHGEAVGIGMVMAFDLSVRLGLCPPDDLARMRHHLTTVGLPTGAAYLAKGRWTVDALMAHMAKDKKVKDGGITFILARGIGQAFAARGIDPEPVRAVVAAALAA
ncbi:MULTISPECIES: 3-dehydroquinate synthase [Nitrospirillum]|uniref:3-dehydroquinate synthase n=1 Tax=Nitrospirillum amazonense TaxID=28077 RepID=A0A560FQJ2_9PROT|nr:3-dehydroquinate synthase [Nitrospirillum amazonense]MEC4592915.1 3-dehydroquinate synthase [Nitrospirillum amazonense]TWB23889.1 3-dehydroquinate synthase [Nitrospirillum amazonense]